MARRRKFITVNDTDYTIMRHRTHGSYILVAIEDVTPGMVLDQGTFIGRTESYFRNQVNLRTWEVYLGGVTYRDRDGWEMPYSYVESRGSEVRVWVQL